MFDLNLCPFKNMTFIDQTTRKFPVDALTKLNPKESFKTIQKRHEKLKDCDWLYSKNSLFEVINKPWVPQHEAQSYMQEAEPLSDFKYLLESGINELKTEDVKTTQTTNVLTFYNELNHLYDDSNNCFNTNQYIDKQNSIPVLSIKNNKVETLNNQILETYKKQKKLGRNIIAKHGIYYMFGLVYFFAQKWLSKIRNKKLSNLEKLALPVKLSDERAENTFFTIRTTDHKTHRSISIIGSLLTYLSKTYLYFKRKATTISHKDITLEELMFFGKLVIHLNIFSGYLYEKVPSYKNYLIT